MIDARGLHDARERIARVSGTAPTMFLLVDVSNQRLYRVANGAPVREYPVSTSRFGTGNRDGSLMTPLGVHRVKEKYGDGAPVGRVFRDRIDTGETWSVGEPGKNLILTRILRLEGCEDGLNRGEGIDSYERYIYIHGTNNEQSIGTPSSHGCVCMKNLDVVDLYDRVPEGTFVLID
jgi:lipoprotein-anchoring transpeptidase ErfK/SrfK